MDVDMDGKFHIHGKPDIVYECRHYSPDCSKLRQNNRPVDLVFKT